MRSSETVFIMIHHLEHDNKKILLIGTAHVSRESTDLVKKTIEAEKPDAVCVELCESRFQSIRRKDRWLDMNIVKVIKEKKKVVVALRDTPISEKDPFTVEERKKMFEEVYGESIEVISIPDIAEVCYGRSVGYKIRRVRLDDQTEEISATNIRNSQKRVIWFTGNTGSGKTSIAYLLKERLNAIVLDGDEMRQSISLGAGFSKKDREEHNLRVARLARILHEQGHNVVVSVIAPYESTRKKIAKICDPY